jgi:hypothetical protein
MDALEREFQTATAEKKIPGVLLAAANVDGILRFISIFRSYMSDFNILDISCFLNHFKINKLTINKEVSTTSKPSATTAPIQISNPYQQNLPSASPQRPN